jgi:hypothetical protein
MSKDRCPNCRTVLKKGFLTTNALFDRKKIGIINPPVSELVSISGLLSRPGRISGESSPGRLPYQGRHPIPGKWSPNSLHNVIRDREESTNRLK